MALLTPHWQAPHWEALTPETRQAFQISATLPFIQRYYLAGGTALALHLGHRFSVDLDFFTSAPDAVGPDERAALRMAYDDPSLAISFDKDMTFVANWRGVGVSFFRLTLYPPTQEPLLLEGVPVAAIQEIGAMKLAAIMARSTRKDYIDLYFILQQTPLEQLFKVAAVKYAPVRTFAVSAVRALTYFADAEAAPMPQMIQRASWPAVKRFLEQQAVAPCLLCLTEPPCPIPPAEFEKGILAGWHYTPPYDLYKTRVLRNRRASRTVNTSPYTPCGSAITASSR